MIKLTVLYGHPTDVSAFETYYTNTHLPIASKMKGHTKMELTKFLSGPDGSKPAYYGMVEFWYADTENLEKAMGSPEGQNTAGTYQILQQEESLLWLAPWKTDI